MMYRSDAEARKALARWTKERAYRVNDEAVSPAEILLLEWLSVNTPIKRHDTSRKQKRAIIGLARSLGLYPIPDWWLVFKRFQGKKENNWKDVGQSFVKQSRKAWCAMFLNSTIEELDDKNNRKIVSRE